MLLLRLQTCVFSKAPLLNCVIGGICKTALNPNYSLVLIGFFEFESEENDPVLILRRVYPFSHLKCYQGNLHNLFLDP